MITISRAIEKPPAAVYSYLQYHEIISGSKNSYIATVVERQSRFTILVKVDGKKTEGVVSALYQQMVKLPNLLKQSLTWDRGTEMAAIINSLWAPIWMCIIATRAARGTNENTNGLLRQNFPKGAAYQVIPRPNSTRSRNI